MRAYSSGSSGVHRPGLEPAAHVVEAGPQQPLLRLVREPRSSRGPRTRSCARRRAARRPPRRPAAGRRRCCPCRRTGPPAAPRGGARAWRRSNSASWSLIQWNTALEKAASTGSASSSSVRLTGSSTLHARLARRSARAPGRSSTARRRWPRPPRAAARSSRTAVTRPEPQPASSTVSWPVSGSRSSTGQRHLDLGRGDAVVALGVPVAGAGARAHAPVCGPVRSRSRS